MNICDFHVTPFRSMKVFDEYGRSWWEKVDRNTAPIGIEMLDKFVVNISTGMSDDSLYAKAGVENDYRRYYRRRETRRKPTEMPLCRSHLSKMFYAITGHGVRDIIRFHRLKNAELLLRYTSLSQQEIVKATGLGSQQNMARVFRKLLNTTPHDYRCQCRKEQKDYEIDSYSIDILYKEPEQ